MDTLSHADHLRLRLRLGLRLWPLPAGLALLALVWLGPLPEMARRAFSAHMMLHLGVTLAAAPLLAIGALRLFEDRPRALPWPLGLTLAASALEWVVVWGWHAPALHAAAARVPAVFGLQQASFVLASLGLWVACLYGRTRRDHALGALAMLFTAMHMAMLGVLLVLAPTLLYAPELCLGAFGLSPVADQQLGGGLMALFGTGAGLTGGTWLALRMAQA